MKFKDIPGNGHVKESLRDLVAADHVPHALMLSGPAGSGKMLTARAFAQYLHCKSPRDGEPCGECRDCRLHEELSHPDLHFIYPIVKRKSNVSAYSTDEIERWQEMLRRYPAMPEVKWLEILEAGTSQPMIYKDDADEIVRADSMPPYASDRKIFIIWLPERMNITAANKLLKVVEEPAKGTVFIFVSNNDLEVLPTIFSRVQRFKTGRLSDEEIEDYLRSRYEFSLDAARNCAPLCAGSLIRADEIGENSGESDEFLDIYREMMRNAYARKVSALGELSERVAKFGREKIRRFLAYTTRLLRENFIRNMRIPSLTAMNSDEEAFSSRFSPFINHANIEDFMSETDRAARDIERNANARIVLFDYFVNVIILLRRKPQ